MALLQTIGPLISAIIALAILQSPHFPTMEVAGVVLAVFSIFRTCLDYFEYFKTAKSLVSDGELQMLKLDFEHERLVIWGTIHGLGDVPNCNKAIEDDNSPIPHLVRAALGRLENLFKNTKGLQDKSGV